MNRVPKYNNHHVFWEKKSYTTPIERRVRNMGCFVIRMNITAHQELHANVSPPPKPEPQHLHNLYNFMQEHTYELSGTEGLEWAIVWANDRKEYELEDNLMEQLYYIDKGVENV